MAMAPGNELLTRLLSAAVLAILPLAGAWFGGWIAGAVVAIAAAIVHGEWGNVTHATDPYRFVGTAALVIALLVLTAGYGAVATGIVTLAAVAIAVSSRNVWAPAGILYAAAFGFGLLLLRLSPDDGRTAIFFVLAVVWATDTGAYFVGRAVGGPKLLPEVSPKKTWSGAIGGFGAGVVAGLVLTLLVGVPLNWQLAAIAVALSISGQAGDLFESWVKRRFGAKDASHLVPGHGGLMDRVDGLVFASAVAALIAWLHGGGANLAASLIRW
jgi:phosphatidate cytidylyltransferase